MGQWSAGGNEFMPTYCEAVCVLSKREKVILVQKRRKEESREKERQIKSGEQAKSCVHRLQRKRVFTVLHV